ncbi:MAG: hypothetical protein ACRDJU_14075, partial [Actinomycetota bacterium]
MAAVRIGEQQTPSGPQDPQPSEPTMPADGLSVPLSWIDSWGGLDDPEATMESCGALGRRVATSSSELPPGFVPVEIPELRSYREAHPLRWGLDRVFYGIAARLWEAPMYVALDPETRPLADDLSDVMAVGALESAMPKRYRLIVPLMRWGGLRWEELAGLRRRSCKPGRISVIADGDVCGSLDVEPRSLRYRASYRLDFALAEDLADHLRDFVAPGRNARVFTHDDGAGLSQPRFIEEVWTP